jgi:cyclopropane fatty-acyl-phospholipid synthase-like methyltransferase
MRMSFHRIAYEALEVCNAVDLDTIEAAIALTDLTPRARALDIGCGNASVSIRLAGRFGLLVEAVEIDPAIVDLARDRVASAGLDARVVLREGASPQVLTASAPYDLIVALGVIEPTGPGIRAPQAMLEGLRAHLSSGGWLLWGDMVWLDEPPGPLRQLVELNNLYTDHDGWQAAAEAAGFEVASAVLSSQDRWDRYGDTMQSAVAAWLDANPTHPDAPAIAGRAHQLKLMFDFGRGVMGFGLYLLRNPV